MLTAFRAYFDNPPPVSCSSVFYQQHPSTCDLEFHYYSLEKSFWARALQFATSDPKGPVYLAGAREVMAETVQPQKFDAGQYGSIGPSALPQSAVRTVAEGLLHAKSPLIITGCSGRNHACPGELVKLADMIPGLQVQTPAVVICAFQPPILHTWGFVLALTSLQLKPM